MGSSPLLVPKGGDQHQPHRSIKKARDSSLKRSQSIPTIATVELEAATALDLANSEDSMDEDNDDVMIKESTESFKGHPVWRRRLSSSLPTETWIDNVVVTGTSRTEANKKSRHSMVVVADINVSDFVSTDSNDQTDHHEPTTALALKSPVEEEEITLPLPPVLLDFSIPWKDVDTDFNTIVSDGAFGKSYGLKWMKAECVVTQYRRGLFTDALLYAKCQRLVKLRHPNLLQLLGFTRESENSDLLVVHEKLSMTLDSVLKKTTELTVGSKLTIANDIAKALCYLHQRSPSLVHCAVVPTNIHLTTYYSAKLSDTGFGKVAITRKAVPLSLSSYLPLEAVTDVPVVSTSLDIFTFGMTLSQMVTHKEPSSRDNPVNKESEKQRVAEVIGLVGEDHLLVDLIRQCLSVEPEARPSAVNLYNLLQAVNVSLLES